MEKQLWGVVIIYLIWIDIDFKFHYAPAVVEKIQIRNCFYISLIILGGIQCGDKIPSSFFSLRLKHLAKTFFTIHVTVGWISIVTPIMKPTISIVFRCCLLIWQPEKDKQYPIDDMTNVFIFSPQTRTNLVYSEPSLFSTSSFEIQT